MSKSKTQNNSKKRLKRFLLGVLIVLVVANLLIIFSGKTYLYKGVASTYLVGKTGPSIYDSLTFPTRNATPSDKPENWAIQQPIGSLSTSEVNQLDSIRTTSFLLVRNDSIILEKYFNTHDRKTKSNTFSAAKSLIGLGVGIAIDQGYISSFDATINNYLPFELENSKNITIRDLLGMSSGLNWSESSGNPFSDNAAAYYGSDLLTLMKGQSFQPHDTDTFDYASGNTQLLGYILKSATQQNPTDFIAQNIWKKIGTENGFMWSLDKKNGMEKSFCCFYATSRDFAKVGQLILQDGIWKKDTIIQPSTLRELTAPHHSASSEYGLHFWRLDDPETPAMYARGILGQYIIAIPKLNMVVVRTGHERKDKFFLPQNKPGSSKNAYKENHPLDLFTYISIAKKRGIKANEKGYSNTKGK